MGESNPSWRSKGLGVLCRGCGIPPGPRHKPAPRESPGHRFWRGDAGHVSGRVSGSSPDRWEIRRPAEPPRGVGKIKMNTLENKKTEKERGGKEARPKPGPTPSKPGVTDIREVSVCLVRANMEGIAGPSGSQKGRPTVPFRHDYTTGDVFATAKPGKRLRPPAKRRNIETMSTEDEVEVGKEYPLPGQKRAKGRPPITFACERLKTRKAEEAKRGEDEEKRETLDPTVPLTGSQAWERYEERISTRMDEMREASAMEISAWAIDCATVIKKFVIRGKNMKGTTQKELGKAVCILQAALHTLSVRAPHGEAGGASGEGESEVEALKRQLQELKTENQRLLSRDREIPQKEEKGTEAGKKGPAQVKGRAQPQTQPANSKPEPRSANAGQKKKYINLMPDVRFTQDYKGAPQEDRMEVDVEVVDEATASSQAPALRPPIKEVVKDLGKTYPPGLETVESRRAYDALSAKINLLLDRRSRLCKGNIFPQDQPLPDEEEASPNSGSQYAAAEAVVPVRPPMGGNKKGKKAPPLQTGQHKQSWQLG